MLRSSGPRAAEQCLHPAARSLAQQLSVVDCQCRHSCRHPCRHPLADAAKRMAGDGTGEHPSVANAVGTATAATAAAAITAAATTAAAAAAAARTFSSRAALYFSTRRPFRSGLLPGTWRRGTAAPLEAAQAHTNLNALTSGKKECEHRCVRTAASCGTPCECDTHVYENESLELSLLCSVHTATAGPVHRGAGEGEGEGAGAGGCWAD